MRSKSPSLARVGTRHSAPGRYSAMRGPRWRDGAGAGRRSAAGRRRGVAERGAGQRLTRVRAATSRCDHGKVAVARQVSPRVSPRAFVRMLPTSVDAASLSLVMGNTPYCVTTLGATGSCDSIKTDVGLSERGRHVSCSVPPWSYIGETRKPAAMINRSGHGQLAIRALRRTAHAVTARTTED